jgi:hypothetical protein
MNTLRLGLTVAAVALGLVYSGSALAAFSPKLTVSAGGPTVSIKTAEQNPSDDAIAKLEIYVPAGFALKSPVGGTVVGSVSGQALVKDIDLAAEKSYTGDVVAISPTDQAVAYENANCDNTSHAAAWMMRTRTDEATVNVPIFVDKTSASEAQFGAYKLVVCMRAPDLVPSAPNRSPMGTKLDTIRLVLHGFTIPKAAGSYRWRSLWTPYSAGTESQNTGARVEAQSIVHMPAGVLTLTAKTVSTRHGLSIKLSGQLVVGTEPAGGVRVGLSHGRSKSRLVSIGSARTNGAGKYLKLTALGKATWFQAGATVLDQDLGPGACTPSFGSSIPCANATVGALHLLSTAVHVKR